MGDNLIYVKEEVQEGANRQIERMSLRQVYRDVILFSLFVGLIFTFALSLYLYVFVERETSYVIVTFASGLAVTLIGIGRAVFVIELWRAILEAWRKRSEMTTRQSSGALEGG